MPSQIRLSDTFNKNKHHTYVLISDKVRSYAWSENVSNGTNPIANGLFSQLMLEYDPKSSSRKLKKVADPPKL